MPSFQAIYIMWGKIPLLIRLVTCNGQCTLQVAFTLTYRFLHKSFLESRQDLQNRFKVNTYSLTGGCSITWIRFTFLSTFSKPIFEIKCLFVLCYSFDGKACIFRTSCTGKMRDSSLETLCQMVLIVPCSLQFTNKVNTRNH